MSERNFLRFTRRSAATLMSLLAVVALSVTGCSTEVPAAPASTTNPTSEEQNRDASWFVNKMHTCVQNKTSEPVTLYWDANSQNDKGEYLNQADLTKTLGPSAFSCAVSFAFIGEEHSSFALEKENGKWDNVSVVNNTSQFALLLPEKKVHVLKPGVSPEFLLLDSGNQQLMLQVRIKNELQTIGNVKVYPVDVYITNP